MLKDIKDSGQMIQDTIHIHWFPGVVDASHFHHSLFTIQFYYF